MSEAAKCFAQFKVELAGYERHFSHIEAAFAQFLLEHRNNLELNVDQNIILGYPGVGELPDKPTSLIAAYMTGIHPVSEIELRATEGFLTQRILEPFRKKLLTDGPYKDRQDIVNNIFLSLIELKKEKK
ncbi:MAG: hypothetical protein WC422_00630 [Candidatus Paceibacterota bacterium]|jgi:hypothetical protein